MAFFNLTMVGYQNIYKEFGRSKTDLVSLPRISNSTNDLSALKSSSTTTTTTTTTTKPLDSNLKYHELRTKHVRSNQGICLFVCYIIIILLKFERIQSINLFKIYKKN